MRNKVNSEEEECCENSSRFRVRVQTLIRDSAGICCIPRLFRSSAACTQRGTHAAATQAQGTARARPAATAFLSHRVLKSTRLHISTQDCLILNCRGVCSMS